MGGDTHGRVYGWAEAPPPLPALGARRPRPHGRREGRGGRFAGLGAALSLGRWRPLGKGGGGGALYSVPQVAVTAGVPGVGGPPACGLRGGGQRALPAVASAAPRAARRENLSAPGGRVRGKLPQEPAGAVGVGEEEKDRTSRSPKPRPAGTSALCWEGAAVLLL